MGEAPSVCKRIELKTDFFFFLILFLKIYSPHFWLQLPSQYQEAVGVQTQDNHVALSVVHLLTTPGKNPITHHSKGKFYFL
jgi:hypothetical protein